MELYTVCIADSEKHDGCNCTCRTAATPPTPFGAGSCVAAEIPAGPAGGNQVSARQPSGDFQMAAAGVRPQWRSDLGGQLMPPAKVIMTLFVSYLANFNWLVAEKSWPEEKQAALFYKGLKEELKDILVQIDPQPTDCQELINLVLRLDHCLTERKGTRKKTEKYSWHVHDNRDSRTPKERVAEPMEIGTIRRPLTKEEKDLCRKNGQCLYCGLKGHFAKDCPIKPKSKRGPVQKVAANAPVKLEN
ncbi:hypothetical protein NDU88_004977 [Pleurodeles waltl]|uniref:CCHC-type domain-containing protein n=1 Tax=Pleurodeles waltl TaxID=8319 RepID=A0AAV7TA10_PLEWA|nr:hypothetical protein NDU88_004977 [Pleurodeles waltl]